MDEHELIGKLGLRAHLELSPEKGKIWLDESRMVMFHAQALGYLRKELIEQLGLRRARSLYWKFGFECGARDAKIAVKHQGEADDDDVFRIGPALHAMEGVVESHIIEAEIDWEKGSFDGFVHWSGCWEAQSHVDSKIAPVDDYSGACWAACGYASGYVTEFFQRLVVFKETQCECDGHAHCVIVGKPAESWEDPGEVEALWSLSGDGALSDLEEELRRLRQSRNRPPSGPPLGKPEHIVGAAPGFLEAFNVLSKAAPGAISVMLLGETGVGKEVFAHWLHDNSRMSKGPFIAVNCSAIPADLVEAELFGVRRGAYTGAVETRPGRFERANGGTLFLDEVGDLPLAAQAKLLRVLQTGEVERLGDDKPISIKVRVISATNVDLTSAMRDGRFRSDLYYRLATYPITIPPLRERRGDVGLLAQSMIERFAPLYDKRVTGLSERAGAALDAYHWPGNVRELENFIERAVLLVPDGGEVGIEHLPEALRSAVGRGGAMAETENSGAGTGDEEAVYTHLLDSGMSLEYLEARLVTMALARAKGNVAAAAKSLNLTRRQMAYRLQKLDLSPSGAA